MSPFTLDVPWISTRSSATIVPTTVPPMTTSCARISPWTVPCRPSRSCRAPRTEPSTMPSIFTTPVLSMSPTIFMPEAMTERPASGGGESLRIRTFSVVGFVKIDIADTYSGCGRTYGGARKKASLANGGGVRVTDGRRDCGAGLSGIGVRHRRQRRGRRRFSSDGGQHLADLFVSPVHPREGDLKRVDSPIVSFQFGDTAR